MTANPQLSDQDIIDILAYTKGEAAPVAAVTSIQEVDPGVEIGKQIFKTNCAACHKLEGKLIGPELLKITDKREASWLKAWIKDNNALVASGDKLAKEVQDSNPAAMTAFPQLSDEDIDNLLKYLAVGDVMLIEPQELNPELTEGEAYIMDPAELYARVHGDIPYLYNLFDSRICQLTLSDKM